MSGPPVDAKANIELSRFLRKTLGCSKSDITLLRGETSRQKSLELPASVVPALRSR